MSVGLSGVFVVISKQVCWCMVVPFTVGAVTYVTNELPTQFTYADRVCLPRGVSASNGIMS